MTRTEGTPETGQRPGRALRWLTAGVAAATIPAITVLALTGHPEQATAIGAIGGAAAMGGVQISVNIHRHRR
ncbi:hypothetical protein [Streptomyces melanogenes]|uniref:hypothetical protein n=1 Tax=Streptomyces melanogenes TaxID=67326 RepID=UPI00167E1CB7|nr:hypothetical protein [Streptomyces melanogenes]GGP95699.1 hypothetical protein GCM10010278_86710 [Streptomyces melanogenes]